MSDHYRRDTELFRQTGVTRPQRDMGESASESREEVSQPERREIPAERRETQEKNSVSEAADIGAEAGKWEELLSDREENRKAARGETETAESSETGNGGYRETETVPDYAFVTPTPQAPIRLIPADGDLKSSRMKLTGIVNQQLPVINIEEDVLVPDVEPDLERILNIEGRPEISAHEISLTPDGRESYRISGTVTVNTLYLPVSGRNELISINSRIDFRKECVPEEEKENGNSMTSASGTDRKIAAELLSVKARVINERKIRITLQMQCTVKKYYEEETEFLEGVRNGELNLRKETLTFTDIVQSRKDMTDIRGEVILRDNMPEIGRILDYDINIIEGRRQIGRGKAVIDAFAYYSILYMPEENQEMRGETAGGDMEEARVPVFCRGKIDFSQFIKLPDTAAGEETDSRTSYEVISSRLDFEEPEEEGSRRLMLHASVAVSVDILRKVRREIVTDMYHRTKDVDYSTRLRQMPELCGSGTCEISVREIITLPETKPGFGRVPYIAALAEGTQVTVENGRCRIEGSVTTNTVYEEEEGGAGFSSFSQKLPFRAQLDLPGAGEGMLPEFTWGMKDIWFDRMNSRQVEFNCTLCVSVSVWNIVTCDFIDKVCYVENEEAEETSAGMVIYMTRPGDTQWSIAKKFRTTMEQLRSINELEDGENIEEGRKLLILG